MKKLLKCVSVFALAFALMPIANAQTITVKSIPPTTEELRNAVQDFYNFSIEGSLEIDAPEPPKPARG